MHNTPTTVIVGGVAGGMSTAARLRRNDEERNIIVFEASNNVSYANCGLPYYVGGIIEERSSLLLQTPDSLHSRFRIDVRTNHRVTAIDPVAQTVSVTNQLTGQSFQQHYDELVLSPGSQPILPNIPGIERAQTLRTVEDADHIVEVLDNHVTSVAIIGGGFIGLELAESLTHRGISVSIIERGPQVLSPFDAEMAAIVGTHLEEHGVQIITNGNATSIDEHAVHLADGRSVPADVVIAAIGVQPDSKLAATAGLELSNQGGILVDEFQRTSIDNIFALGDAATKRHFNSNEPTLIPLAQTANRHGRLVADIICGRNVTSQRTQGTAIIGVFGLAAATTGWNERTARNAGFDVRVVHIHPSDHAGYYPGATQLHLKLIIDAATDNILGAQAVGSNGADKRIDVIATSMRAGMSASDLADLELAYSPQYGSAKDPVNIAGMVADNLAQGEQTIQWHQLTDDMQIIDVRSPGEHAQGHIPGSLNISVDELRTNLDKLDPTKPVVVACQVGLRGHVSYRLLQHYGLKVINLDGGYLTYTHGMAAQRFAAAGQAASSAALNPTS